MLESLSETRISSRSISSCSGLNFLAVRFSLRSRLRTQFLSNLFRTGLSNVSVSALFLVMRDLSFIISMESSRGFMSV